METADKVEELLPKLYELAGPGIIDVQDTTVVKPPSTTAAPDLPHVALRGRAKLMRIYISEGDQWHGQPLYEAIVEEARRQDLAGATVYRGLEGYGASTRIHRKHLLTSSDLPIMVSIIDEESKITRFLPTLDVMVKEGLVAVSEVEVIRYVDRARR